MTDERELDEDTSPGLSLGCGIPFVVTILGIAYLLALPLMSELGGFYPWLHGGLAPVLAIALGAATGSVGLSAVLLLRKQPNRALRTAAVAVLCILLAWAIDVGCYFEYENRYQSKPRRQGHHWSRPFGLPYSRITGVPFGLIAGT